MFDVSYFHDIYATDGEPIRKPNITSIHFNRLNCYHKSWKLKKIVMFEFFLVRSKRERHEPFTCTYSIIEEFTTLSDGTITKIIRELVAEGYISFTKKSFQEGKPEINWYTVNFDEIMNSFDKIYDFTGLNKDQIKQQSTILREYYTNYSAKGYKNKKTDNGSASNDITESDISIS